MTAEVSFKFFFHPKETEFPCNALEMKLDRPMQLEPQVYALGPYDCVKENVTYNTMRYSILYRTNPGVRIGNIGPQAGFHKGDIEFILVLSDKKTKSPVWVYFSAHGSNEGTWRKWKDCQVLRNETLQVYVALGSHANYPTPGIKKRVLYCANDICAANGKQWFVDQFIPASSEFDKYTIGSNLITKQIQPKEKTWNTTQRITQPVLQAINKKITSLF